MAAEGLGNADRPVVANHRIGKKSKQFHPRVRAAVAQQIAGDNSPPGNSAHFRQNAYDIIRIQMMQEQGADRVIETAIRERKLDARRPEPDLTDDPKNVWRPGQQ